MSPKFPQKLLRKSSKKISEAGPSQRQLRVGEDMRHHLASILMRQETHIAIVDASSITVSEVTISPDLSHAKAFVMTLGGGQIEQVIAALNQYAPVLRHQLAKRIYLRRMPALTFAPDERFEQVDKMNHIFKNLKD